MEKWSKKEIEELKNLYQENDVPSDQLIKDKVALDSFTANFNARVVKEVGFNSKEVADRLLKLRKSGKLPRLRR
jgi:hypothetical protein